MTMCIAAWVVGVAVVLVVRPWQCPERLRDGRRVVSMNVDPSQCLYEHPSVLRRETPIELRRRARALETAR